MISSLLITHIFIWAIRCDKTCLRVSVKVRFIPACSATEILLAASLDMILSNKRITKALIRQRGCAGWSAPLLFANPKDKFSCIEAHIVTKLEVYLWFWFGLLLYIPVNSFGHVGTVSSPNYTFFVDKLEQAFNQYFVHILSLVTDNPS